MSQVILQLGWIALESLVVGGVLLLLFRLRPWFGHSLLYLTLGSFQYLQTYLAVSANVVLLPGIVVNPGSAVLFTGTLFTILLVYISEDMEETRRLIYGIILANFLVTMIGTLFSIHVATDTAGAAGAGMQAAQILQFGLVLTVGTLILFADVVITIAAYTWLRRRTHLRFVQVLAALSLALIVDSLLFVSYNFWSRDNYLQLLNSSVVGKLIAAIFFSTLMASFLRRQTDPAPVYSGFDSLAKTFRLLTYSAPVAELQTRLKIDELTGVYNRSFFDRQLRYEVNHSAETGRLVSLLMVDLDHFKRVNDRFGHQAGDELLRMVGKTLLSGTRATDYVCRYGGEEFAIVLPGANLAIAGAVAEKIRILISELNPLGAGIETAVTATIGAAECPGDGGSVKQLIKIADRRLYVGKREGRNRVVSVD